MLARRRPKIIAITGSVGKTGTKDAIYHVLSRKFFVWKSEGNYNNEIGLPLAVLGVKTWKKSVLLGLSVVAAFFRYLAWVKYPEILVLEMGADKKGDIEYLTNIARPDIAVVTRVGAAHLERFGGIEEIQREKSRLAAALKKSGTAILNADDPRVCAMSRLHSGKIVTFGLSAEADVRAEDIEFRQNTTSPHPDPSRDLGIAFWIRKDGKRGSIITRGILGHPQIYSMLAAFAVAGDLGMAREEIFDGLRDFESPAGRLRPLAGIKRALILDDTYNSSPEASVEALRILKQIRARRRIAVLGDMLELGAGTENLHRKIGRLAGTLGIDMLCAVGERAKFISDEARKAGFAKSRIIEFEDSESAGSRLRQKLQEGDAVLVKGSRGMQMEKIVRQIMAEPERADELLYHSV